MASENKKNKWKRSYSCKSALKAKGKGIKRLTFFTSAQRQQNKKFS